MKQKDVYLLQQLLWNYYTALYHTPKQLDAIQIVYDDVTHATLLDEEQLDTSHVPFNDRITLDTHSGLQIPEWRQLEELLLKLFTRGNPDAVTHRYLYSMLRYVNDMLYQFGDNDD